MVERETVKLQHGVWVEQDRLAAAGLDGELEITVGPGEIRIRGAASRGTSSNDMAEDPLLQLAGTLSHPPISSSEIDRRLYGNVDEKP